MPAPTFIQEAETAWASTSSPKTTAAFPVQAGDVLVAFGLMENGAGSITISGGGLTWTQRQVISLGSAWGWVSIWTATVASSGSITVTFTAVGSGHQFGGNVLTFRGSDGIGASGQANASGAPSLALTTTQDNSAIVVANVDWNALSGSSRVWRSVNGAAATEVTYDAGGVGNTYTPYGAYHPDAGTAGSKTVGLSAPTGQKYALAAVEVLGAAGGASPQTVSPSGVVSAEAAGSPTVTPGAVSVAPSGVASGEAFGTAALGLNVRPSGVGSGEATGTPAVTPGAVSVGPSGVGSGEAVGVPSVSAGGVAGAGGIASGEAHGQPSITTGPVTVQPSGVPSGEAFGLATLGGGVPQPSKKQLPTLMAG